MEGPLFTLYPKLEAAFSVKKEGLYNFSTAAARERDLDLEHQGNLPSTSETSEQQNRHHQSQSLKRKTG